MKILVIFAITITITFSVPFSEAKAVKPSSQTIQRARRAAGEEDPHHGAHGHEDEALLSCPVTEHVLTEEFSKLAEELILVGDDGALCVIEDEDHGMEIHEEHDDHASSTAASSCETYFEFVQQLLLRLNLTTPCCLGNESLCEEQEPAGSARTPLKEAYGYGFLMVVLISLCSLLGVLFVPLLKKNSSWGKCLYEYIYALMIALGASALFCDAILHLIPQVFGLHGHSAAEEEEGDAHEEDMGFIWKGCVVIGGLYFFFLFEFILHSWNSHSHSHHQPEDKKKEMENSTTSFLLDGSINRKKQKKKTYKNGADDECTEPELTLPHGACRDSMEQSAKILHPGDGISTKSSNGSLGENDVKAKSTKRSLCPKRVCSYISNIKPLAWLILLGDGIHNFADGLALGAAISHSLSLGIGTTIAIVFHEIPHEIGDFVILISTGMTWYAALLFNFFSALLAVIGFFVGVAVSVESSGANEWILAAAAGLFIYIALVDLLPELIHLKQKGCRRWGLFLVLNVGFMISFVVLLLLAIFEDQLNTLVNIE